MLKDINKPQRTLEEYCYLNGLEVNSNKTKIVPFTKGELRPQYSKTFLYKDTPIEVVDAYTYLGIIFSSTEKGQRASLEAVKKVKALFSAALGILCKTNADSWPG